MGWQDQNPWAPDANGGWGSLLDQHGSMGEQESEYMSQFGFGQNIPGQVSVPDTGGIQGQRGSDLVLDQWLAAAQGDVQASMKKWDMNMAAAQQARDFTMGGPERTRGYYDEYMEGIESAYGKQEDLISDYTESLKGYGEEHMGRIEDYAGDVRKVASAGAAKARGYIDQSIAAVDEAKAEYTDQSMGAIAAQAKGLAARGESSIGQMQDSLRRQGAPESVINAAAQRIKSDIGTQLQGAASQAATQYANKSADLGMVKGQVLMQAAGVETQIGGMEVAAEGQIFGAKAGASQFAAGLEVAGAQAVLQHGQMVAGARVQAEGLRVSAMIRAEELASAGQWQYADFVANNPIIAMADVYMSLMNVMAMPGDQGAYRMPGAPTEEEKRFAQIKKANPQVDWSRTDPADFESMMRESSTVTMGTRPSRYGVHYG